MIIRLISIDQEDTAKRLSYCGPDYIETLIKNNIDINMTVKHAPYENAVAERIMMAL